MRDLTPGTETDVCSLIVLLGTCSRLFRQAGVWPPVRHVQELVCSASLRSARFRVPCPLLAGGPEECAIGAESQEARVGSRGKAAPDRDNVPAAEHVGTICPKSCAWRGVPGLGGRLFLSLPVLPAAAWGSERPVPCSDPCSLHTVRTQFQNVSWHRYKVCFRT